MGKLHAADRQLMHVLMDPNCLIISNCYAQVSYAGKQC